MSKLLHCLFLVSLLTLQKVSYAIKILSEKDLSTFTVLPEQIVHSGSDAAIRKITDGKKIYILKQIRDSTLDEQFLLINDCIASTLGHSNGIAVNQVFFIPFNVASNLKLYPDRAATLHQFIQGNDFEKEFPKFLPTDFTLHQRSISKYQPTTKYNMQGLTKSVIESMQIHNTFSEIVALDTFIGNSDRSEPNIVYDSTNNTFWGIDQAAAFTKRLPYAAIERLNSLIQEKYFKNCSQEIIQSLRIYRNTLLELCQNIKPSIIEQAMHDLVTHLDPQANKDPELIKRIDFHNSIIKNNYKDSLKLIELLNKITLK